MKTVGDLVRWGASQLNSAGAHFGHGTDNAADESRLLVFHALALDFQVPDYFYSARVTKQERDAVTALFARRIDESLPAAYLTGEAWFAGLKFAVTPDVLIPRSPIAELIACGFDPWCDPAALDCVLELGTGSGCIAIAIAHHLAAQVDAVEVSPAALAVAQRNVELHDIADSVRLIESDLYTALGDKKYDLIVSNPPYVGASSMRSLPGEYQHEPELALAAGDDGLSVIHRIIQDAAKHLQPNGVLVVEAGESAAAVAEAYPALSLDWVEFENGGDGVFITGQRELLQHNDASGRCA